MTQNLQVMLIVTKLFHVDRDGQPPGSNEAIFQDCRVLKADYERLCKLQDELVDQNRTFEEFSAILRKETLLAKKAAKKVRQSEKHRLTMIRQVNVHFKTIKLLIFRL